MARGKNYYRSEIEPFFPHGQFSPTEKLQYSRISPRKNGYIVAFPLLQKNGYIVGIPPERMTT
jgi:hypothetical protein